VQGLVPLGDVKGGGKLVSGRGPVTVRAGVATVLLVLLVGGCGTSGEGLLPESGPSPTMSGADLWLSFDSDTVRHDGSREYPDALGHPFAGRVLAANGGTIEAVQGAPGRGYAVAFPSKCATTTGCPRAMLEVMPGPSVDPGETPFAYGASVWLSESETTVGSNILQKGRFGSTGGQWKLQVDGLDGHPSCVIRSGPDVFVVKSKVPIADSEWHHVSCRRDAAEISIDVDGTVDRKPGVSGSVTNLLPITIGGPGIGDHDDQFHGRIDDVFLEIGSQS
jgi:Concanavalin A-like lectin/glucanases superfamily